MYFVCCMRVRPCHMNFNDVKPNRIYYAPIAVPCSYLYRIISSTLSIEATYINTYQPKLKQNRLFNFIKFISLCKLIFWLDRLRRAAVCASMRLFYEVRQCMNNESLNGNDNSPHEWQWDCSVHSLYFTI